ncbi:SDR family oxidoreductase [Cellulomonas sp. McL0617]|uniref:SDR family oxidoreductase n=1 Tax=Cellulomonas sp. McL0617 TaxID=3415675 RepID=UPI003CF65FA6
MRVFVTGASGWIGSAVTAELLAEGHEVVGLARSDASAAAIAEAGASTVRGGLDELDVLRTSADKSDAVIHLGFNHDFGDMAGAWRTERAAVQTFVDTLEGSERPLLLASGVAGLTPGRVATERDASTQVGPESMRGGAEHLALSYADRGVRSVGLRFAPTVHGQGDHGFVAVLAGIARTTGVSGYVGDGANRWPAVHRLDAARLVRLALERAPAGSVVHAVGEEGVAARDIAEAIGQGLGVATAAIEEAQAAEHFGWIGRFFALDTPASSTITRELLGWAPTRPGLLDDLAAGYYTS